MKIFAIGDLHLPGNSDNKEMNVFGSGWDNHWIKIQECWRDNVAEDDVVLIPGDLSWGMTYADAYNDLKEICQLSGHKVLLKGNHDYWWSSISRLRDMLFNKTYALQNDAIKINNVVVVGTRGWISPEQKNSAADVKIYEREAQRLAMSIADADKRGDAEIKIGMMHFPPFAAEKNPSKMTKLFSEFGVNAVVYGHMHAIEPETMDNVFVDGIQYHLVSCDYLDFKLLEIK